MQIFVPEIHNTISHVSHFHLQIIDGKKLGVEIILDDPAGNSFIQVA